MTKTCFVIQPFDGGPFDDRYHQVYGPAIQRAGFEPYRVDVDFSASIPIERIETEIRNASACFADISLDNPNVWYELGVALASNKEICIVCAADREKFPFDVQHRLILRYKNGAPRDFDVIGTKITERLKAIAATVEKSLNLSEVISQSVHKNKLDDFEINAIGVLAFHEYETPMSLSSYIRAMDRAGYTSIAANIALRRLIKSELVIKGSEIDFNGYSSATVELTELGWDWANTNIGNFSLRKPEYSSSARDADDEIPF